MLTSAILAIAVVGAPEILPQIDLPHSTGCRTAGEIVGAYQFLQSGDPERAWSLVRRGMKTADLCAADLAMVYRVAAEANVVRKETEIAQRMFEILLAVAPAYRIEENVSPATKQSFDAARRSKEELSLMATARRDEGSTIVQGTFRDSLYLTHQIRVHAVCSEHRTGVVVTERPKLPAKGKASTFKIRLPNPGTQCRLTVTLTDRNTAHLKSVALALP